MNKFNRFLYRIGIYQLGYENKMLTPLLRALEPFVLIIDGVLGIVLFATPYVPCLTQKLLRVMIKQQCRKRIAHRDKKDKATNVATSQNLN